MITSQEPEPQRVPVLEFLSGFFAGIGIILLTLLLVIVAAGVLEQFRRFRDETHFMAVLWTVLAFGTGVFVFRRRAPERRSPSFTAGLVTAAALFLLLDSACWNFSFE